VTIPDETLMAFADGALPAAEMARIAAALEADPALAERVAALADGRRIAARAFAEVLHEPVPARLLAAAMAPAAVPVAGNDNRRPAWRIAGLAAAAGVALGVFLGARFGAPDGPVRPGLLAGGIAAALDGDAVAGIRVTGTHVAEGGLYCRRFVAEDGPGAMAGLACREPEGWRLRVAVARGPQRGAFQPAGAEDPVIAEVLERLGAGAPLDAAAEAEARRRGWRQP
jgi:anti-sigma factor RsiW